MRIKTTIANVSRVKKGMEIIAHQCPEEFTSKEYNSKREKKASASLDYLRTYGIIYVAREENIKVKVKNPRRMNGIFTENGTKIMEEWEWDRLPANVKTLLAKTLGELFVGWEGEAIIDAKKYYYKVNEENLERYLRGRLPRISNYVEGELTNLRRQITMYENVSALVNDLGW